MKKAKTQKTKGLDRRSLLKASTAIAAPLIIPSRLLGKDAPSNTLQLAIAGSGIRGGQHMGTFSKIPGVRMMAVCDVWPKRTQSLKNRIDQHNGDDQCKRYADYREMLTDPAIDAVSITVPDHWHAQRPLRQLCRCHPLWNPSGRPD